MNEIKETCDDNPLNDKKSVNIRKRKMDDINGDVIERPKKRFKKLPLIGKKKDNKQTSDIKIVNGQQKLRRFEHIDGNWAVHVYIPSMCF